MQDFRMETFLTVCRLMNYTHAAQALHITQPAVSLHVRFLEAHYGVKLFDYAGKKLSLTPAGRLLRDAATTLRHDDLILKEHLQNAGRHRLVFGATLTIGDFDLPRRLVRLIRAQPDTEVRMLVDNTQTLLGQINTGALDFAVIEGYYRKSEYEHREVSRQRYVSVCAANHVFAREPCTVQDLLGERVILREPGSGTREIFERYLEERNGSIHDFAHVMEIGSISAIKQLVAADCGITFLYESAVAQELAEGSLCLIPLQDFEVYNHFAMVWRKGSLFDDRYLAIFDELLGDA